MNKKFIPVQKMLYQFNDFVTEFKSKLEAIPLVWTLIGKLLKLGVDLNEAILIQTADNRGYTLAKTQRRENLAHSLISIMNLIYTNCLNKNQLNDIENYKSTYKKLLRMSFLNIKHKAVSIIEYCDMNTESLAEMGISAEMLQLLKDNCSALESYMALPQEMIKKKESATLTIESLAKEIDRLQIDQLNKLMESFFKLSDPEVYAAYLQAVRRERIASRKMALIGSVKDSRTRKPVPNARVLIPEAEIVHSIRGAEGGFRISHLDAGTFPIEFSATNYKSQIITLVHNFGVTDRLDVFLEPASIDHL
ncbi:carboxypeptidase family protein [Ancylomarina subtilis]|uniref:Carboxypeptidase family protein n=1 Tax=Ancylomarina subtilis TaxID=1639035 RepID=A0A4Q7VJE9_9BACT|nr:carboxypeptidase-like regulatory domain-containing protein [Ancylomarina subtilis]RZT96269.1 carboxypeptidase family protein [Ancylomarina subtilis]